MREEPDLFHQRPDPAAEPAWLDSPQDPIEEAFVAFHRANPQVYARLETEALKLGSLPKAPRFGISLIFEVMRHDHLLKTEGEHWKLNNNFRALYARLLLHHQPHLTPKLEMRERHLPRIRRAS